MLSVRTWGKRRVTVWKPLTAHSLNKNLLMSSPACPAVFWTRGTRRDHARPRPSLVDRRGVSGQHRGTVDSAPGGDSH